MGQQILVLGLGTFGSIVARELTAMGHEVMGCDRDVSAVADLAPELTQAMELDATDQEAMREVGPAEFDVAVVSLDRPSTILATMLLEQLGVPVIVARAASELDGEILRRVGADRVVYTDRQMAHWVARTIDLSGAIDFISLAGGTAAAHLRIGSRSTGRRVEDVVTGSGLTLVALVRGSEVIVEPEGATVLAEGDSALVVGPESAFRALAG